MLLGGMCGDIPPPPGASKGNGFVIGPRSGPHPLVFPNLPSCPTPIFLHMFVLCMECPCGDMYFCIFVMPCVMMLHTMLSCRAMHVYISSHTVGVEIPSNWRGRLPAYINKYLCMCPPPPPPLHKNKCFSLPHAFAGAIYILG